MTGYQSPHGKPRGLADRLTAWADRMGRDSSLPWAGLGIIGDLKLAAAILNKREWLDAMYRSSDPDAQQFARELMTDDETYEAANDAAAHVQGLPGEPNALDPVATIEKLDELAVDYEKVRGVLVDCGALADDDEETPIADLVRALLA